jgi:glutaminyl-peptide cyclotransferase
MNLTSLLFVQSKPLAFFTVLLTLAFSCNSSNNKIATGGKKPKQQKLFTLQSPILDDVYQINDTINFTIKTKKNNAQVDSTLVYLDGVSIRSEVKSPLAFSSISDFIKVGRQNLRLRIFYDDSLSQTITTRITLLSDIQPTELKFTQLRSIPHDPDASTQGLFYHEEYLYEGTGQETKSKIVKIDPENGNIIRERKLEPELFGEGIALYNDQIFQLTYKKKVGFVYDLETFERIREFDLQTAEGWGLTTNGEHLIVSDGSSALYFYQPEYFNQVNQLDVCNKGALVTSLNELEYTNGSIWANIYGRKYLVRIDAATGKVTGTLDLSSLFPKDIPEDYAHVLNGIAFNSDRQTFFVTGKLWPLIYEIKINE